MHAKPIVSYVSKHFIIQTWCGCVVMCWVGWIMFKKVNHYGFLEILIVHRRIVFDGIAGEMYRFLLVTMSVALFAFGYKNKGIGHRNIQFLAVAGLLPQGPLPGERADLRPRDRRHRGTGQRTNCWVYLLTEIKRPGMRVPIDLLEIINTYLSVLKH